MATNIDTYMAANPSLTFTQALQALADARDPIFIPATTSARTLTRPIIFNSFLSITGENSNQISGVKYSAITAGDLHGRPMFCSNTHYLDCNNVYRDYRSRNLTTDEQAYTVDPTIDNDVLLPLIRNQSVTLQDMNFSSTDSFGCIMHLSASYSSRFVRCFFSMSNRGLLLGSSFLGHIEQCEFSGGTLPSWFNVSSTVVDHYIAGTANGGELAQIATLEDRIKKGYACYIDGNASVIGCRITGHHTGLVINGNNTIVDNLACERNMVGLGIGNYPVLDVSSLQDPQYVSATSTKPNRQASGCRISSLAFESNRRGVDVYVGSSCRFLDWILIGHNARDYANRDSNSGGSGYCNYGIKVNHADSTLVYDGLTSVVNDNNSAYFSVRSIAASGETALTINETENSRAKITTLESTVIDLDQTKAELEAVQIAQSTTDSLKKTKADVTAMDALAGIVASNRARG